MSFQRVTVQFRSIVTFSCRLPTLAGSDKRIGSFAALALCPVQAVLLVKNLNQSSPGYQDYLWFQIPFYDSRYQVPPEYAARDTAGTGKFIYGPSGKTFGEQRPGDGNWVNIDRDLLPLIRDGLQRAWRENFMTASRDLADLHVVAFSIGWELPGPLVVEMRLHDLSLQANPRKPTVDEIKKL